MIEEKERDRGSHTQYSLSYHNPAIGHGGPLLDCSAELTNVAFLDKVTQHSADASPKREVPKDEDRDNLA